jgi:hypothetical protein
MNEFSIANEVKIYHRIAVLLRICNDCFIGSFAIVKNNVLGEDDIMFNSMDGHVVNALVKVGLFHAASVIFHQTEGLCRQGIL